MAPFNPAFCHGAAAWLEGAADASIVAAWTPDLTGVSALPAGGVCATAKTGPRTTTAKIAEANEHETRRRPVGTLPKDSFQTASECMSVSIEVFTADVAG